MVVIRIFPTPPSLNNLYCNIPGRGRIKSGGYTAWLLGAGLVVNAQKVKPFDGPVDVTVRLPAGVRGDADNRVKPVLDLLKKCGVIKNDSRKFVRSATGMWTDDEECTVEIVSVEQRVA
jgi:Holliday junction resolvase RusA-like endonuclease